MIADTNVLLRPLDREPGPAQAAARRRIASARATGEHMLVLSATVLEMAFVLASDRSGFGWDRRAVASAIEAVIDDPAFDVEHAEALRVAAGEFRRRSIDLHDCLIHAVAAERGTRVLSFDDDLRRLGTGEAP